jgi:hypothetical protein
VSYILFHVTEGGLLDTRYDIVIGMGASKKTRIKACVEIVCKIWSGTCDMAILSSKVIPFATAG